MRIKGLPVVRAGVLRADLPESDLGDVFVRFSPFDTWYEINSFWEGRFLERTMPGTFRKTIADSKRSDGTFNQKMLFDHGMDFQIGDKPLAVPDRFAEINVDGYHGPELAGPLIDTDYNRDQIAPLLRANALGSSFMFEVIREEWDNEPDVSEHNPDGIPERTIREVRQFEAGPVTWPASPTATAGMRCRTDDWMQRVAARNQGRHDELVRSYEAMRALHKPAEFRPNAIPAPVPDEETRRQIEEANIQRAAVLRARRLDLMRRGY